MKTESISENVIIRTIDLDGMGGKEFEYWCSKCKKSVCDDEKFCKHCGIKFEGIDKKDSWGL